MSVRFHGLEPGMPVVQALAETGGQKAQAYGWQVEVIAEAQATSPESCVYSCDKPASRPVPASSRTPNILIRRRQAAYAAEW